MNSSSASSATVSAHIAASTPTTGGLPHTRRRPTRPALPRGPTRRPAPRSPVGTRTVRAAFALVVGRIRRVLPVRTVEVDVGHRREDHRCAPFDGASKLTLGFGEVLGDRRQELGRDGDLRRKARGVELRPLESIDSSSGSNAIQCWSTSPTPSLVRAASSHVTGSLPERPGRPPATWRGSGRTRRAPCRTPRHRRYGGSTRGHRGHGLEHGTHERRHFGIIGVEEVRPGTPVFGCRSQRGVGQKGGRTVTRHVDFGHHGHEPLGGVRHDVLELRHRVEAAGAIAERSAPSDLGQAGQLGDLDAPTLVVGQVHVQHVELVQAQQVDDTLDRRRRRRTFGPRRAKGRARRTAGRR